MGDHRAARALSLLGEHSGVWLAAAATGAVLDPARRRSWLSAGRSVVVAHGASVVLKRVFRVRRPAAELRVVGVPSEWSFPSSHATGSAAAAVALGPLLPRTLLVPLAVGVAWSRVRLGVHRRRDVLAGALLGAALSHRDRRRLAQAPSSGSRGRGEPWTPRNLGAVSGSFLGAAATRSGSRRGYTARMGPRGERHRSTRRGRR